MFVGLVYTGSDMKGTSHGNGALTHIVCSSVVTSMDFELCCLVRSINPVSVLE
jgi:hypothetical protein